MERNGIVSGKFCLFHIFEYLKRVSKCSCVNAVVMYYNVHVLLSKILICVKHVFVTVKDKL
jgi:hypothetical protein